MTDPFTAAAMPFSQQTEEMRTQLRTQSEAFWNFQDRLLDHVERMSHAWIERRHEGVRAAMKAAFAICNSADPAEALQEYMQWAGGSVERLTRDAVDAQAYVTGMSDLVLGATHKVMHGPSEAGRADIMTPTDGDAPTPVQTAA
ncbi:MAG: hypothetical protein KIT36_14180 [Alphaproteobacteria bacterium]|nr:hypothetical protein [Alphaproteobacteria bacterium]